ncbi:MAG: hypothetical protein HRU23_15895 [Gammaproteobacteria bacterium]|nr:hypothetical protein [Gammaproteobacteria bacterium]
MVQQRRNCTKKLKRLKLGIAVSLALVLTNCDSDSAAINSFSSQAGDGQLKGALVCLDINNNALRDSNEPCAMTDDHGAYQFSQLDPSIDLSKVQLLVKAMPGQNQDEDSHHWVALAEPSDTEPKQPPKIIADSTNTKLLQGNSYLINDDEETLLVNFSADSILEVMNIKYQFDHQSSDRQQAQWTIDKDKNLLIVFDDQWFTLKLTKGLGTDTIFAIEQDENGMQRDTVLNLITPITVTSPALLQPLLLTRDEQCSLTMTLNDLAQQQGSVIVDATHCSDISQEMAADIFETSWFGDETKKLTLEIASPANNYAPTTLLFSDLTLAKQPYVLMTFEHFAPDSSQDSLLDFVLWKKESAGVQFTNPKQAIRL